MTRALARELAGSGITIQTLFGWFSDSHALVSAVERVRAAEVRAAEVRAWVEPPRLHLTAAQTCRRASLDGSSAPCCCCEDSRAA